MSVRNVFNLIFPRGYFAELRAIIVMALPLIVTMVCQFTNGMVALMFCGRLGEVQLAATAMANNMIDVMGLSIAVGLSSACDTLFSQIYGSKHRKKLGIVFIRSMIFIPLCVLPALAVHLNATNVLLLIGQDAQVARLAAEYLLIFIPGLLGFFLYIPMTKFLQSQNVILPSMIIGLVANVIHVVLQSILVLYLEYGLRGSAIAQMTSFLTFPCLTLMYILWFKVYEDTWTGWSTDCFVDWSQFFWLGWFGLLMVCIEWWSYEVGLIMAGILGTKEMDAQAITMQVAKFCMMAPLGVGVTVSIRVGQFLGADDYLGAITCYRVALSVVWIMSVTFACSIILLRSHVPLMFTVIPEVLDLAAVLLSWYAVVCLFEGTIMVYGGVLRGSGRQTTGALVTSFSYILGLTVAILVTMKTQTIQGFWHGMITALTLQAVTFSIIIIRTDWEKQSIKALERASIATKSNLNNNPSYVGEDDKQASWISKEKRDGIHLEYIKTCLITLCMVSIFISGVLCRIFVPPLSKHEYQ